jgi:iron complex outermembrane receptor protein
MEAGRFMKRTFGRPFGAVPCTIFAVTTILMAFQLVAVRTASAAEEVRRLEPVVVTGSLIPTTELVTATPVDIYTSADISKYGSQTVRQFLNTLPSAIGSGNFGETRGNGGDGSAAVSIRGIQGGTLVLINGRRLAQNELFGSGNVDINMIPLGVIERIEVLKDGASALYGADAQAGVINVITKKGFTGTEMYASYGNTVETDVGQQAYYFVTGAATEKSSVMVGGNYYRANSLFSFDRDRSRVDLSDRTSLLWLRNTSGTSNPGRLRTSAANDPDDIIPAAGLVFGAAPRGLPGEPAPGTTPSIPFDPTEFHTFTAADRFPFPIFTPAIRNSERWSIFGEGSHQLFGEHLEFFTEGMFSRSLSHNELAPTPIVFFGLETETSPGGIVIPAENFYNPFGIDMSLVQYRGVELGPRTEDITADFFRFVGGFRGKIADTDYRWETAVLYNEDYRVSRLGGEFSRRALESAVARTDELAFNPFGREANSPAQLALVSQLLFQTSKSILDGIDAQIGGPLFELPGGKLEAVIGGGHYEQRVEFEVDNSTRVGDTVGFNQANPFSGQREFNSAYGEIKIPITGNDFKAPMFESFELSLAGRWDEYSDFGSTENPKVVFRWQPFEEPIVLRGSYGTSFIPPSFGDLNFVGQSFPELFNPFTRAFEQPIGGTTLVGNPNLAPEKGENWTAGAVWKPSFVKGLTLGIEYYRIRITDRVAFNTQFLIDQNFRTGRQRTGLDPTVLANQEAIVAAGDFAELINFQAGVGYLDIITPSLNLGGVKTDGLDITASYELPTDNWGKFTLALNGTYVITFDRQVLPGQPFDDVLGDFIPAETDAFGFGTIPRIKGNLSCFWNFKSWELGATANYVHHVRDYALAGLDREISSIVTVDLQASYTFPWDMRVTLGILNIADQEPPRATGAFADNYDRDTHDLRQRFVYFSVLKRF